MRRRPPPELPSPQNNGIVRFTGTNESLPRMNNVDGSARTGQAPDRRKNGLYAHYDEQSIRTS